MSDLQVLLAKLAIPSEREPVYAELALLLPAQLIGLLQSALQDKRYTYRHNGLSSARCKAALDKYIAEHSFSPTSPSRAVDYIQKYRELLPDAFAPATLRAGHVLDYGCGIHNPLSLALILYLNGAQGVVATDPGRLDTELAELSIRTFVLDFLQRPAKYNLGTLSTGDLMARFSRLNWSALLNFEAARAPDRPITFANASIRDLLPDRKSSIALILSTTVLEHVEDLQAELQLMHDLLVPGGRMVHRIDLTDHRHFLPDYHPLAFVKDGVLTGLNGLRYKDIRALFHAAGFRIDKEDLIRYPLENGFMQHVHEKFRGYTQAEIEITYAGVVLTKERMPAGGPRGEADMVPATSSHRPAPQSMDQFWQIEELADRTILRLLADTARANGLVFSSCLDIGCGLNPLIDWFRGSGITTEGARYFATDAHDDVLTRLQQRGVYATRPEDLPRDFTADLVIAQEVLEHITPAGVEEFVAGLRDHARKMVALTCPNFEMFDPISNRAIEPELRFVPDHLGNFDPHSTHPYMHKLATTPDMVGGLLARIFGPDWTLRVFRAWPWRLEDLPAERTFQVYFKTFALAWKSGNNRTVIASGPNLAVNGDSPLDTETCAMTQPSSWHTEGASIEPLTERDGAAAGRSSGALRVTERSGPGSHWINTQLEAANNARIVVQNVDAAGIRIRLVDKAGNQLNWWGDFSTLAERRPDHVGFLTVMTRTGKVYAELDFRKLNLAFPVSLGIMLLGQDFATQYAPGRPASVIFEPVELNRPPTNRLLDGVTEKHPRDTDFARAAYLMCRGRGLEIGALYKPFDLDAEVVYLDMQSTESLQQQYAKDPRVGTILQVQLVWKGNTYPFIDNDAFDFVINSHVLEHVPNPGRQMQEWLRIVRPGGLVYMIVPDKRFCFDRRRELTEIDYLIGIHHQNLDAVPIERYRDFITGTQGEDGIVRDISEAFVQHCHAAQSSIHVHTFTAESLLEFARQLAALVPFDIVHHQAQGLHIHLVLQKRRGKQ
jgi:SAM-dependent methyltransferase